MGINKMKNNNIFDLKNKTIIITGGAGHIGTAISKRLAQFGANVIICSNNYDEYKAHFSRLKIKNIIFQELDISSVNSIKNAFENIYKKYKNIDVLINNAFYTKSNIPEQLKYEDWNFGIDGTLNSVFRCIKEIMPYMKKNNSGSIINMASMYGFLAPDFRIYKSHKQFLNPPNYGAAKAGVIQLTKYFASYLSKYNIRVNSVSPGPFPSLNVQKDTSFIKELTNKVPLNRIGKPDDLSGVFILLASDGSKYITGQNIIVDGGWSIW
jgi:gluconate 5-dehydrogenase